MWLSIMNVLDWLQFYIALLVHMCLAMMENAIPSGTIHWHYGPVDLKGWSLDVPNLDVCHLISHNIAAWDHSPVYTRHTVQFLNMSEFVMIVIYDCPCNKH